jgi:hypothetical protein
MLTPAYVALQYRSAKTLLKSNLLATRLIKQTWQRHYPIIITPFRNARSEMKKRNIGGNPPFSGVYERILQHCTSSRTSTKA